LNNNYIKLNNTYKIKEYIKTINIIDNNMINNDNNTINNDNNKSLTLSDNNIQNIKDENEILDLTEFETLDINNNNKSNSEYLNKIDLDYINDRIDKEICNDSINKLEDSYLLNEYKESKSLKNNIKKLELLLEKYNIEDYKKESILKDYILDLIPPGTKGVIRGNKFNSIVKDTINNLKLNNERFEVLFEQKCNICITSETPDWYILEKSTSKVIIGMNQLDLWGGGQQINRGFKYLIDNKHNTEKSKLLCVVCNKIKFNTTNNKAYKLFEVGYLNDTLCYLKNIKSIINKFFN
jgi:hypothetical protein